MIIPFEERTKSFHGQLQMSDVFSQEDPPTPPPRDGVRLIVSGSLIKRCSFDHVPQTALLSRKVLMGGGSKLESNWDRLRFTRSTKQFTTAAPRHRYLWRCRGLPVVLLLNEHGGPSSGSVLDIPSYFYLTWSKGKGMGIPVR